METNRGSYTSEGTSAKEGVRQNSKEAMDSKVKKCSKWGDYIEKSMQ